MKLIKYILPIILLTLLFTQHAIAQNFDITSNTEYIVDAADSTQINQTITITNNTEFHHVPSYSAILGLQGIREMQVTSQESSIPFSVSDTDDGGKHIEVVFPDRTVGLGTQNTFTISYKTNKIAQKLGNTWEVNVPGITNIEDFKEYSVNLSVPPSFGDASIVKTNAKNAVEKTDTFDKEAVGESGILLMYGEEEYYALGLKYTIENANLFPVNSKIALPPKTPYQETVLKDISHNPKNVYVDRDGNYMAEYMLKPQETKEIQAKIIVKVHNKPQYTKNLTKRDRKKYLEKQEYWETDNKNIQILAEKLKTPENIYNYVIDNLTYNNEKVTSENTRLGAASALSQTHNAACLEFTDLFITIARAAGIPARAVEGYAYTQNSQLKPLSLSHDVLHAWPEYYDEEKRMWIMVDPTWGNTTSGIDYFHTLDFSHITFVTKGIDSTYPIPAGGYKGTSDEKDVNVSFADKSDFQPNPIGEVNIQPPRFTFPFSTPQATLIVKNVGNAALQNKTIKVSTQESGEQEFNIDIIPPMGETRIPLEFEEAGILTNNEVETTIHFDGQTISKKIHTNASKDALMIGGGSFGGIALLTFTYKARSLFIQRRRR